jgi:nucleoid DNA-binding protein/nucleoid-associated protein YgaU
MSQEKLNFLSLSEHVAHKAGVSRKEAEDFLRLFASLLDETLLLQEPVKIKGLGALKPQWNAPRKSVDVNTGEEITLAGYFKVSFSPEASLKESVNAPYAHLEPVILSGGDGAENRKTTPKDKTVIVNESKEEVQAANLDYFSEQASEIKGILSEINAIGKKEEHDGDVENNSTEEPASGENEELVVEAEGEKEVKEVREVKEDREDREVKEDREDREVGEEAVAEEEELQVVAEVNAKQQNADSSDKLKEAKRKNQSVFPMLILGIVIGVALVYILSYLNILPGLKLPAYHNVNEEVVTIVPEPELVPDTIVLNEVAEAEPIDSLQLLFDTPREYNEFLTNEKVVPGSRLTRIAERHYGVKLFWVFIYEANKSKIPDPENLPVGILLRIPKLNPVLADQNNERCMNYLLDLQHKYLKK